MRNRVTVVQNPAFLSIPVRFRNAKGQYTKPHLARFIEFKPPRARKPVRVELPKGRHKKAQVLDYARQAVYAEQARREAKVIKREEKIRERLPEAPRGLVPDAGKLKVKRRVQQLFSKKLESEVFMVGYNVVFAKKMPVYPGNYDELTNYLYGMILQMALDIIKKEGAWGQRIYIKIFGDGLYKRSVRRVRGRSKIVPDRLGFSIDRAILGKKEHLEDHLSFLFETMRSRFFTAGGRGGYFNKKVNSNEYYFTGFRIEIVTKKG